MKFAASRHLASAAVLVMMLITLPAAAHAAGSSSNEVVYVPIENGVVENESAPAKTQVRAPGASAKPQSRAQRASTAVAGGIDTAASVPYFQVPGTGIPLWWLLLMALAVPLARVWRGWTSRMFE